MQRNKQNNINNKDMKATKTVTKKDNTLLYAGLFFTALTIIAGIIDTLLGGL